MEEFVDLLDDKGEVIGVVEKTVAHKQGLWHKVVHVWIMNSKNEILVQKRCSQKAFYPNVWDVSVGGHVGAGEKSLTSVIREVKEEIGLTLNPDEITYIFTFADELKFLGKSVNEFADVFLVSKDIDISALKFQREEVETVKWMSLTEFSQKCFTEEFLPHVRGYQKFLEFLKY